MGAFDKEFRVKMSDEPGALAAHCEAIAAEDVNILAIVAIAGNPTSAAIVTDNADATITALDDASADYSVSELQFARLEHKPGSLAAFTREMGESGINITSLYVMAIEGNSATIGYTTDE